MKQMPHTEMAKRLSETLHQAQLVLDNEKAPASLFRATSLVLAVVRELGGWVTLENVASLDGLYQGHWIAQRTARTTEQLLEMLAGQTRRLRGGHAGDIARLAGQHGKLLRRMVGALQEEVETDRVILAEG